MREVLAGFRATARQRTQAVVARLARTTPRERVLLAVLVLGALVYAPIAASDWRTRQEDRYVAALTDRASAELAAAAARRIRAVTADQAALEDMRTWGFEALNAPIAAVEIEQRLLREAERAGLTAFVISMDSEPEAEGPTQWMEAEVEADLRWTPTFAFIDAVAAWPEGFRVTRFAYDVGTVSYAQQLAGATAPSGKLRLGLAFPVRLAEIAVAPAPGTAAAGASGEGDFDVGAP
ncbi:hypothetical protein ACO2Q1_09135 [Brevundimonas sp. VNH65]|uniref:hypothetical protein n=1 Tax=Brevundimonas sp. VNH65 TaxID=3400917 RepID=UPI003C093AD9